mmetsp:Transcript_30274/g.77731  ORF Transcript_30274/g.77731 Transcript_30274/m.77731 type:complete len:210 (-) Transcript_30274:1015-1644(-)
MGRETRRGPWGRAAERFRRGDLQQVACLWPVPQHLQGSWAFTVASAGRGVIPTPPGTTGMAHRSPINSAETTAPCGMTPSAAGSSRSALAERALSSRELSCPPVDSATSSPPYVPSGKGTHFTVALWYSGRCGSSLSARPSRTFTRRREGSAQPDIFRMVGTQTRWKVTRLLTGLPGRPNTSIRRADAPSPISTVAKVSGLPGFILTRP